MAEICIWTPKGPICDNVAIPSGGGTRTIEGFAQLRAFLDTLERMDDSAFAEHEVAQWTGITLGARTVIERLR